jgi:amino acid transporter
VLLSAFTLGVNWFGVMVTTRANFAAVGLQVAALIAFLVIAVVALFHGFGTGGLTLIPVYSASAFSAAKIFSATSICIMSFLGFDAISTLSEEVEGHDRRVVGRAIIAVLVISAAFFIVVTFVLGNLLVRHHDQGPGGCGLRTRGSGDRQLGGARSRLGLCRRRRAFECLPMQVGVARVLYAMGRDRQLPHALARVHRKYGTPYVGMLVTTAISTGRCAASCAISR